MQKLSIFLIILCLPICSIAQSKEATANCCENIRLDQKKPSVFITFENFLEKKSLADDRSENEVILRLNNNTRWDVFVKSIGQDKEYNTFGLTYEVHRIPSVEANKNTEVPIGRRQIHISNILKVKSGNSVLFTVSKSHIAEGLMILVNFTYDWEILGKVGGDLSIQHQAPFWSTDLPTKK